MDSGQMSQPMVRTVDLKKAFGDLEVLRGISLDIARGEVVAIIGASGSGKSTFLRCINRLEEPTGGQVFIDGEQFPTKEREINRMRAEI